MSVFLLKKFLEERGIEYSEWEEYKKENEKVHILEPERIIELVSNACGYTSEQVLMRDHKQPKPKIRFVICNLIRLHHPRMSLVMIGEFVGGRDHATVLNAFYQHKDLLEVKDPEYTQIWEVAKESLKI